MQHHIDCEFVDVCFPEYLTDIRNMVGVQVHGQTFAEFVDEMADEIYGQDDIPYGDYVFGMIKQALRAALDPGMDLCPVDANGTTISDPDAEIPDDQPSVWCRFTITSTPLRIVLDNQGSDEGSVLVTCANKGAAEDDGDIDGSSWETPRDMDEAYTILCDRPSLVADLEADGYEVDASCYSPPDEDVREEVARV